MTTLNPTVKFTIEGDDKASAEIKKVRRQVSTMKKGVDRASESLSTLRGTFSSLAAGDVSGVISNLGAKLGRRGFAAKAGVATVAVGALAVSITTAAKRAAEWAIHIERMQVQLQRGFGGDSLKKAQVWADTIGGLTLENVAAFSGTITQSGIQARITSAHIAELALRATEMGKTGDEALRAFADAIRSGSTSALEQVGIFAEIEEVTKPYAEAIGATGRALTRFERQQAIANYALKDLENTTKLAASAHDTLDKSLARLDNQFTLLKSNLSELIGGPAAQWLQWISESIESLNKYKQRLFAVLKIVSILGYAMMQQMRLAFNTITDLAFTAANLLQGNLSAAKKSYITWGQDIINQARDIAAHLQSIWTGIMAPGEKGTQSADLVFSGSVRKRAQQRYKDMSKMFDLKFLYGPTKSKTKTSAKTKTSTGPDTFERDALTDALGFTLKDSLGRHDLQIKFLQNEVALIQRADSIEKARLETKIAEIKAKRELIALEKESLTGVVHNEEMRTWQITEQLEQSKKLIKIRLQAAQLAAADKSAKEQQAAAEKLNKQEKERQQLIWGSASATAKGVASMIENERARAAVMAAVAAADAFRFAAAGNIPSAISSGFASVAYAKAAATGAPATGAGGGGFASGFAERNGMQLAGSGGGGATTIITNYNGIFETKQSLAKKQKAAAASLAGSGV